MDVAVLGSGDGVLYVVTLEQVNHSSSPKQAKPSNGFANRGSRFQ